MKNETLFYISLLSLFNINIGEQNMQTEEPSAADCPSPDCYVLSDWMKEELQKGIDDYNNGNYLTQEELNKELEEWIKEE